jgi:hypothetical protein
VTVRARFLVAGLFVLGITSLDAQPAPQAQREPAQASDLPVRRVILYKSGVGYFEHIGSVAGNATVAIQFTTAQLNDVLQSLTALDLDGGSIGNISYNSVAPLEQRLAALRLPLGADTDRLEFYKVLRGARVEVRAGAAVTTGRLLTVEQGPRSRNGSTEVVTDLTLVSDDGAVKTVELTPGSSVHLDDRDVRSDLSNYLSIVASSRGEDVRRMVLSASGSGTRRLFVSYISEVPIWKSTYRLVLPSGDRKPVLQGWAVVDNTVGQDWTNVELSLVAGAPQSFVQQISQPYYVQRPVVPLPPAVLLQPQTHAATLIAGEGEVRGMVHDTSGAPIPGVAVRLLDAAGNTVTTAVSDDSGAFACSASPGAYTVRAELQGFQTFSRGVTVAAGGAQRLDVTLQVGSLAETVTVSGGLTDRIASGGGAGRGGGRGFAPAPRSAATAPPPPPPPVIDYMAALSPAATAQDLGDLFEYKLKQPVTIRKNESALVPILNADVDAERVSLWSRGAGSGRPLRGVWLTNSSTLTLDGGSFSVVDGDAFAGQGLLESIKPGEKRLVSYGADLAVLVKAAQADAAGHVVKVVAHDGVLIASQEDRATWKYTARNEDTSARTLIVEHPIRPGWTVGTEPAAAETSPTAVRYRLALPPKQEATLTVTERHAGDTTYRLADFDDRTITILVRSGASEPSLRRALQPLIDKRTEVAAADARLAAVMTQIAEIDRDQQRVRENMKALRGTAEEKALTQRYTRQLSDQEDKLASLRDDQKKATADRDARRRELAELAARMTFEISG